MTKFKKLAKKILNTINANNISYASQVINKKNQLGADLVYLFKSKSLYHQPRGNVPPIFFQPFFFGIIPPIKKSDFFSTCTTNINFFFGIVTPTKFIKCCFWKLFKGIKIPINKKTEKWGNTNENKMLTKHNWRKFYHAIVYLS